MPLASPFFSPMRSVIAPRDRKRPVALWRERLPFSSPRKRFRLRAAFALFSITF